MTAHTVRDSARPERDASSMAHGEPWAPSPTVLALSVLAGLLAATAAVAGLVWQTDGAVTSVTTLWGERVELYGRGLYRNDYAERVIMRRGVRRQRVWLVGAVHALSGSA